MLRGSGFQSAPPCGGRPQRLRDSRAVRVSIRAPVRGATSNRILGSRRGGAVSIRAPVRGATPTVPPPPPPDPAEVSIRAPVRGATWSRPLGLVEEEEFQSAPPCGGRLPSRRSSRSIGRWVSIRAPVRGATGGQNYDIAGHGEFQSAPPCGGRPPGESRGAALRIHVFQSAPPCGGRPSAPTDHRCHGCFNPRPRAGGDCTARRRVDSRDR